MMAPETPSSDSATMPDTRIGKAVAPSAYSGR